MASAFAPSRFERLHRLLLDAVHSPAKAAQSNDWYIAVDRHRAELVDLGRVKPRSDAERKEIESGTYET